MGYIKQSAKLLHDSQAFKISPYVQYTTSASVHSAFHFNTLILHQEPSASLHCDIVHFRRKLFFNKNIESLGKDGLPHYFIYYDSHLAVWQTPSFLRGQCINKTESLFLVFISMLLPPSSKVFWEQGLVTNCWLLPRDTAYYSINSCTKTCNLEQYWEKQDHNWQRSLPLYCATWVLWGSKTFQSCHPPAEISSWNVHIDQKNTWTWPYASWVCTEPWQFGLPAEAYIVGHSIMLI